GGGGRRGGAAASARVVCVGAATAAIPADRGHGRSHKPSEAVGRGPAPDGLSPKIKNPTHPPEAVGRGPAPDGLSPKIKTPTHPRSRRSGSRPRRPFAQDQKPSGVGPRPTRSKTVGGGTPTDEIKNRRGRHPDLQGHRRGAPTRDMIGPGATSSLGGP